MVLKTGLGGRKMSENIDNKKNQLYKRTPLGRINKWNWVLLLSVLLIIVISVFSYQRRGSRKFEIGTDSLKIEEGSRTSNPTKGVVPETSKSGQKANGITKDSIKMDSISSLGNSNVPVDNAVNVINPIILEPTKTKTQ